MNKKLLNRNYVLLVLITFCSGLTAQLLNTALPLFLVNALGSSTTISGLLSGLYTLVACIIAPISGIWVDRKGRKPYIYIGFVLFALGSLCFGLVRTAVLLVIFRLTQGVGFGISGTASSAATTDNIPSDRLGEGLGYLGMANAFPMLIGPSIALFLIGNTENGSGNYALPFIGGCILCIVALLLTIPTKEAPEAMVRIQKNAESKKLRAADLFELRSVPAAIVMFFAAVAGAVIMVYGSLYAQDRGLYSSMSAYYVISALGMILIRFPLAKIVDKVNGFVLVIPTALLWIVGFVLMLVAERAAPFLIGGLIYGVCLGVIQTVLNTISLRGISAERRGAAVATFKFSFDGGIGLGAMVLGIIADALGYGSLMICGIVMLICSVVFSALFMIRGYGKPEQQASAES